MGVCRLPPVTMSQDRHEWKVGIFVTGCLVLVACLLVYFSRGASLFRSTYTLQLTTGNVGGIKREAAVLMSGIRIGHVGAADLGPEGTNVVLRLRIDQKYRIRTNSTFVIEQSGFLGDQYVSVYPRRPEGAFFEPGSTVTCEEPFNLQEVARSAAGFIQRVDETARKLNEIIARLDRSLLNQDNISNLIVTVQNLRTFSDRAVTTMDGLDSLVQTNLPPINLAISNLVAFSGELGLVAGDVRTLVRTNGDDISRAVKNVEEGSELLRKLLQDMQGGRGMLGVLMKDRAAEVNFGLTVSNLGILSSNLTLTASNLNSRGLWGVMWGAKPARPSDPAAVPRTSKGQGR